MKFLRSKLSILAIFTIAFTVHAGYCPETGRFLQRDPIEEKGGVNIYRFVYNNAINNWDFLGLRAILFEIEKNYDDAIKKEDQVKYITPDGIEDTNKIIDKYIEKIREISDEKWGNMEITFDGKKFKGTKKEYIERLEREKGSKIIRIYNKNIDYVYRNLGKIVNNNNKEWDETAISIHGVESNGNRLKVGGNFYIRNTVFKKIKEIANTVKQGRFSIISCFSKEGRGETASFKTASFGATDLSKCKLEFTPYKIIKRIETGTDTKRYKIDKSNERTTSNKE